MSRGRPGDSVRGGHANARRSDAARGARRARDEDSLATLVRAFEGLVARGVGGAELDRWVAHEVRAIGVGQDAATLRALGAVRWGESGGASRGRALTRDVVRGGAPVSPWEAKTPIGGRQARAPGVYALASAGLGGASMQGLDPDALGPGVTLEEALSATAFARIAAAFPGLDLGRVTLHQEA
ncbi:MAG: hypothetical protein JNJ59_27430, partial [Deltaproteobacteria bacterium]|nr:hypothetical protein [Deltaproteobacteria bacterium]